VGDDEAHAGWRRDRSAVFVAKATHASPLWLLLDPQFVSVVTLDSAERHGLVLRLDLGRHALWRCTVHLLLVLLWHHVRH
jgi:hypothetical protein